MCDAIRGMIEDGKNEGRKQGIEVLIETCQDFKCSKSETTARIMDKFSLSQEDADGYMKKYWQE